MNHASKIIFIQEQVLPVRNKAMQKRLTKQDPVGEVEFSIDITPILHSMCGNKI